MHLPSRRHFHWAILTVAAVLLGSFTRTQLLALPPDPVLVKSVGTTNAQGQSIGFYYMGSLSSLRKVGPWSIKSRTLPPLSRNDALAIAVAWFRKSTGYTGRIENMTCEMRWFHDETTPKDICQYAYNFSLTGTSPNNVSDDVVVTMDGQVAERITEEEYEKLRKNK
ncbi:hypothetical protein [Verrucomicrobium sp. BvORR034]|uniref:hypothetical protein n=1 Tax=Verrucomicrobium sp. BvORR034 TaxID=1396418 RepID=UPI0006785D35|nr:hypothetical protein [Verrucomicrobium sp. BvORR034]